MCKNSCRHTLLGMDVREISPDSIYIDPVQARSAKIRAVREDSMDYSIQLEALFLINQLVFEHPFNYSATPVLKYTFNRYVSSLDEHLLALAYEGYRRWFKAVQIEGLQAVLTRGYRPLDGTTVEWY